MNSTWLTQINPNTVMLVVLMMGTIYQTRQGSKIKKTAEATHILSNSAMGEQKRMNVMFAKQNAVWAHRLAAYTKDEGDLAAANNCDLIVVEQEKLYQEHQIQQAKVDATLAL